MEEYKPLKKPEEVDTLVASCLLEGITKGTEIVSTVSCIGFPKKYVGLRLNLGRGLNPDQHFWSKDADGCYQPLVGSAMFPQL